MILLFPEQENFFIKWRLTHYYSWCKNNKLIFISGKNENFIKVTVSLSNKNNRFV